MSRRLVRHPHRDDERGAVAIMSAMVIVIVLTMAAFVVDIGLSRASARDMQAVADSVALDTARSLPSCDTVALTAVANTSLARQGVTIGQDAPLSVIPGHLDASNAFVAGSNGSGTCDAVRITSTATVTYAFAPVIGTDDGTVSRSAVGTPDLPAMCFSAGTRALVLNTSESALGPVLDQILQTNLSVGGYSGLIDLKDLSVPLADLNAALAVGTGQALVDSTTVSLGDLLIAQATVLENGGNAAEAVVLRSIAAQVSSLTVDVTDMLLLDSNGNAGLTAEVNALDFAGTAIIAAATLSNGTNALDISSLGISVAGISLADAKVTIIEPPVIACGRTGVSARTAQVRIDLDTGVNVAGVATAADIDLGIRVAQGTATLNGITCSTGAPTATIGGQTSTASVVGYGGTGAARLDLVSLSLPLLGRVPLGLGLQGGVGAGSGSHTFTYPAGSGLPAPPTHTFGSPVNLNLQITPDSLLGLGTLLGLVVNPVLTIVNQTVGALLTDVLGLLGIRLGTMDVTVLGRPSCDGVRLAG